MKNELPTAGQATFHTPISPILTLLSRRYAPPGCEGQPQSQAAIAIRVIDFGHYAREAIEAARRLMGHTWGAPLMPGA
jgi:gamma-glutamyltranspeptidase